jgi:plasmid maintenance system antidote protein VapI
VTTTPAASAAPFICPPDHKHDASSTCYTSHECRCGDCREARRVRGVALRKAHAYGRFVDPLVDAAPVQAHIQMLRDFGLGDSRIAELAGVDPTGVRVLIYGRQAKGDRRYGQIPKRTTRDKAEKILALRPDVSMLAPGAQFSARGAQRRLQALTAIGWPLMYLANALGVARPTLDGVMHNRKITARRHREIAALFDELWATPFRPVDLAGRRARSRALTLARSNRWLPPMAWDDIDTDTEPPAPDGNYVGIDQTAIDLAVAGVDVRLTVLERREAVRHLVGQHLSDGAIAERLHIADRTVLRIRDELDLAATDPDRRRNAA